MKIKTIWVGIVILLPSLFSGARPGETYTLTGEEKGVAEIIKADMEQYPELYRSESLNSYILKFKRENKIGKRKLSPGDQLRFPETLASIKAKRTSHDKTKKSTIETKASSVNPHPLGSWENPVKCSMPKGERAYLSRLRDSEGKPPEFKRMGSFGQGVYGHIVDGYKVTIAGTTNSITIYMDMYHANYIEPNAVPGFTIVDK